MFTLFTTNNRFAPLENQTNTDPRFNYINATPSQEEENVKIHPIYVNNIVNLSEFNREIKNKNSNQFTSNFINNRVKLMFKTTIEKQLNT